MMYSQRVSFLVFSAILIVKCTSYQMIEGDVTIAVILALRENDNGTCGSIDVQSIQNLEAMKWITEQLNAVDPSVPFSPGVTIGLRVYETCESVTNARHVALNISLDVKNNVSNIVGVIGPHFSSEAEVVSQLLGSLPEMYRLPQVGYASTSASLSNHKLYRNYFRTIPPDTLQTQAMYLLMLKLNWTYFPAIFEDDAYGRNGIEALEKLVKGTRICMPEKYGIQLSLSHNETVLLVTEMLRNLTVTRDIPFSGILLFGHKKLNFATLEAANILYNETSKRPVLMFSESAGNFEVPTWSQSEISKGSLVFSPPRRNVSHFHAYWRELFTDTYKIQRESSTNHWLNTVLEHVTNCNMAENGTCRELTVDEVGTQLPVSIYSEYAIQAVLTMAEMIREMHDTLCTGNRGLCDKFIMTPKSAFIDHLSTVIIKFNDYFQLPLDGLNNLEMSFDENGDVRLDAATQYEVYNYQKCQSEFCFVKVGQLKDEDMVLDPEAKIKFYDKVDQELEFPDLRKAQCPDGADCKDCIPEKAEFMFIEGELYIVAIVPVHSRGPTPVKCGNIHNGSIDIVESIQYAIEDPYGSIPDFPSATVGAIIFDSCNDAQVIQEKILLLHRQGLTYNGVHYNVSNKIIGYIGGMTDDVTIAAAEITSRLGFALISYGSTSSFLSKQSEFPYFLRIPNSDLEVADRILTVVRNLGKNYVQILYSESTYGDWGKRALESMAKSKGVCIARTIPVQPKSIGQSDFISAIGNVSDAKVVILLFDRFEIEPVLKALGDGVGLREFIFIATESWGEREIAKGYSTLQGAITITQELSDDFKTFFSLYLRNVKPNISYVEDPWLDSYMENYFGCYYQWSFKKSSRKECSGAERLQFEKVDTSSKIAEYAVHSLLRGAYKTRTEVCGEDNQKTLCPNFYTNVPVLVENIKKTYESKLFKGSGEGIVKYKIHVFDGNDFISMSLAEFLAGGWPYSGTFNVKAECDSSDPVCAKCFPIPTTPETILIDVSAPIPIGLFVLIATLGAVCCLMTAILLYYCNKYGCCCELEIPGFRRWDLSYITAYDRGDTRDGDDARYQTFSLRQVDGQEHDGQTNQSMS